MPLFESASVAIVVSASMVRRPILSSWGIGRLCRLLPICCSPGSTAAPIWASRQFFQAQSELLWLVGRRPGISVRAAATELGLVPNTASTMVSKLVANGLTLAFETV